MANYNDNDLEELDFGESSQPTEAVEEKKPSNRNFMIAIGIIGGIFVLAVIALIIVATVILPGRQARMQAQNEAQLAANTATAQFATDQVAAEKAAALLTPTVTPPAPSTAVPTATNTPVVAPQSTHTPTITSSPAADSQKMTLSAQQTQLAGGKVTTTVIATSTALPNTGFADEVGLPGLLGVGLAMIVIIFLARRLRTNPTAG